MYFFFFLFKIWSSLNVIYSQPIVYMFWLLKSTSRMKNKCYNFSKPGKSDTQMGSGYMNLWNMLCEKFTKNRKMRGVASMPGLMKEWKQKTTSLKISLSWYLIPFFDQNVLHYIQGGCRYDILTFPFWSITKSN